MNNVDPFDWLSQTLTRIAKGWPASEIEASCCGTSRPRDRLTADASSVLGRGSDCSEELDPSSGQPVAAATLQRHAGRYRFILQFRLWLLALSSPGILGIF
jgi:hypothetical protein